MDDQLPGVLEERAGLVELTVPRASFSVVTSAESLTLFNMVPTASEPEKLGGRVMGAFGLCEKNSGEVTPSALKGPRAWYDWPGLTGSAECR